MKKDKIISKTVERYDGDWPPTDAAGAIAWFQAQLAEVPEAFRSTAQIEIDAGLRYGDDTYATIEISYVRPATQPQQEGEQ
ncbi:MAG: hypothetical protein ABI574_19305 [Burkholderiales bacterium]